MLSDSRQQPLKSPVRLHRVGLLALGVTEELQIGITQRKTQPCGSASLQNMCPRVKYVHALVALGVRLCFGSQHCVDMHLHHKLESKQWQNYGDTRDLTQTPGV